MPTADLRVFLVEDHPWLLETQALLLEMQDGLTVCGTAGSAEEALDALDALAPPADVVVADMRLPGLSGAELVGLLRERHPRIAGLIHSAKPAVEMAAAARDAGAVAYVEKGDAAALVTAIRACAQPV